MKRILWAILVMAISTNLPAPLFPVYQQNYGLTPLGITTLFALYAACLLPMLLISGSITDRKGKKAVVLMGIFFACLSALCFAIAKGAAMLYLARMLEGFGIGLFMGTSNALLVENTKEHVQSALGYASMFNMFGFGFGPLLCGIIAEYSSAAPYRLPYLLLLAGLLAAIVLVFTIREGTNETAGPLKIKIGLGVPKENRKIFWKLIAPAAFLMLALNGVVISLIPTYVKTLFHTTNLSYSGGLLFVMLFGSGIAQLIRKPRKLETRVKWGIILLAAGTWGMISASMAANIGILFFSMAIQALGTGWTFQSALRLTGEISAPENRSRIISTFYICAYSGMAFPTIGIGLLSTLWSLSAALLLFGILLTIAGAFVVIGSVKL